MVSIFQYYQSISPSYIDDDITIGADDVVSLRRGGKQKDKVWEHFESVDILNDSHKGAKCKFCSQFWKRGKPNDMKAHLALKCTIDKLNNGFK